MRVMAPAVFRNRSFVYLYLGGLISVSGSTITSLILIWLVYTETKSALAITFLGIASILPTILLGLLTGVFVDRLDRRVLMIISDLARAALVFSVPVYLIWRGFSFPLVLAIVVLVSVCSTVFRPATNSLLPMLVSGESVQDANGLISATNSLVQMVANAVGGLLIGLAGVVFGLFYNVLTYILSASLIFLILVPPHLTNGATPRTTSFATDFKEGLRYMRKNTGVFEATLSATFLNFFGTMVGSFLVIYVAEHLKANGSYFGLLLAALATGLAAGSLAVWRLRTVRYAGKLFAFTSIVFGLGSTLLGLIHSTEWAVPIVACMGLALGLMNTTFFSIIQLVVPNEILGRVLSVDEVGSYAAIPIGQIVAGVLISTSGIVVNYLAAGLGIILTGIAMLFLSDLRNLKYINSRS